jgi:pimeloyl-ACP methyl ester carboxylesterase
VRFRRRRVEGRVRVPTLILWGRKDVALSPDLAAACLDHCEDGRIEWLPEATHWLHHEEPARVNAMLTAFLRA